ncbi:MAG: response regulator [Planctomycetes bacterium]|nr:response regulator [Planctomycetota bacterium]
MHRDPIDVVVIDDDPIFRMVIESVLQGHGVKVRAFSSPTAGLEHVLQSPPRLLILDWMMPGLKGDELLVELGKGNAWGSMTVFLVTATQLSEPGQKLMATLGAHKVFIKPLRLGEFLQEIAAVLELETEPESA